MPTSAAMSTLADQYGYQLAFLKSDKELYSVFQKAVDGKWDSTKFVAAVRNTKWYKAHSETWRTNQQLKYADPASYKAKLAQQTAAVRRLAGDLGVSIGDPTIALLAENAFMFGWDENQLRSSMAVYYTKQQPTGRGLSGEVEHALRQTAYRNGIRVSDSYIQGTAQQVALGKMTVENAQQMLRERYGASVAPGFAKEIAAGQDLYDLASPYMQTMARTLELNPSDIDLFDPTIRKALASSSDKDGQAGSIPLWQFEQQLKKDQRWLKTKGARDELDSVARNLSRMFGVGV